MDPGSVPSFPTLEDLATEGINPASAELDRLSPIQIVELINREDHRVAPAVAEELPRIARGVEVIAERLREGGRLIYVGAGTSGRLGVLDAAECPPTFNSDPRQVVGIIAGGPSALRQAVEGAEDSPSLARQDLLEHHFSAADVLVGIATSGRTPYVLGALEYARELGAYSIGITCNPRSQLDDACDLLIRPVVGPEVLSGSTRMKAGTATKLVLNMLTTGAMVLLGKTYGNLMVDLRATNTKLLARTVRIVRTLTQLSTEDAESLLRRCNGDLKTAIVVHLRGVPPDDANRWLEQCGGRLREALQAGTELA